MFFRVFFVVDLVYNKLEDITYDRRKARCVSFLVQYIGGLPLLFGFYLSSLGTSGLILLLFLLVASSLIVTFGVRLSAEFSPLGFSLIIGGSLILFLALYLLH